LIELSVPGHIPINGPFRARVVYRAIRPRPIEISVINIRWPGT
jgi:hypothetical protein